MLQKFAQVAQQRVTRTFLGKNPRVPTAWFAKAPEIQTPLALGTECVNLFQDH